MVGGSAGLIAIIKDAGQGGLACVYVHAGGCVRACGCWKGHGRRHQITPGVCTSPLYKTTNPTVGMITNTWMHSEEEPRAYKCSHAYDVLLLSFCVALIIQHKTQTYLTYIKAQTHLIAPSGSPSCSQCTIVKHTYFAVCSAVRPWPSRAPSSRDGPAA